MYCLFCELDNADVTWEQADVLAFRDGFPVSPGHTLLIPRRHVATWFEATESEQRALMHGVAEVKRQLDSALDPTPDGYNVGFNTGEAAGQTVMHLHLHVIPRFRGDMPDPRGGVRGVIPWRQKYQADGGNELEELLDLPKLVVGGHYAAFAKYLWRGLALSEETRLLAAFIQPSGLDMLAEEISDALARGARIRVLTGDYKHITSSDALRTLLEWTREHERFEARLYQCADGVSFHPKAYLFERAGVGVGYIGSSNVSRLAMGSGVEWNLRTLASWNSPEFAEAAKRFDGLFNSERTATLTKELIDAYEKIAKVPFAPEPRGPRPEPHRIQEEALAALEASRSDGARRAMVVMATGLGKTYLAAFDVEQVHAKRVLFVAHREEILKQALVSWQRIFPERYVGLYVGDQKDADADILFASVQSLSRKSSLKQFPADHFDYIVVDEFHHAAANTYRRILSHFTPRFLLGLTATPDRMDGASLLGMCDDNLAFRAGLVRGIAAKRLVPFHYFGVTDSVDFQPIPWRSGHFDSAALTASVATDERAAQALSAYHKHAPEEGRRTLAFCCSVAHADFMADYFQEQGIKAAAVHSQPTSAPRAASLRALTDGRLEVLFAVDLFNEGLDIPDINVVLMLRPTESPVIFLQQLGRGLRLGKTIEKPFLTIVDFIGNHRSFLQKPQALLALTDTVLPPYAALRKLAAGEVELPPGCKVSIETEAIDLLEQVAKVSADDMLIYEYCNLRDSHGRRPTAGEVFASGLHFKPVHDRYGTWFDFVDAQGDLSELERRVLERHRAWLTDIGKKSRMTKSFKIVALRALLDLDALRDGATVDALAARCRELLRADPALHVEAPAEVGLEYRPDDFAAKWRKFPLEIWAASKGASQKWFELTDTEFTPRFTVLPEDADAFDTMTSELVDLRLREHRSRLAKKSAVSNHGSPIPLRVSHSSGRPILRLDRKRYPETPEAGTEKRVLIDDQPYFVRFQKVAANVAMEVLGGPNVLPRLMRQCFGPSAGLPGSRHYINLVQGERGWALHQQEPDVADDTATIIPFPKLPYYSSLAVACGTRGSQAIEADDVQPLPIETNLPHDSKTAFVVRATGESMNGGSTPIRDGDLVLCEWVDATKAADFEGVACLLSGYEGPDQSFAQIKRPVRRDGQWYLASANPEFEEQAIDPGVTLQIAGRVLGVVSEPDGITLWGKYDRKEVVELFGQNYGPSWRVGHRNFDLDGEPHTFLFVTLRKPASTKLEHRYADRFLSRTEFQWESQASTKAGSKKGRSITDHKADGREIHLFVRPEEKVEFVYCGRVEYLRHVEQQPMRVWFRLLSGLPRDVYRRWVG